ncbi:hypothetical protein HID58_015431, partial [Brassica napus]
KETFEYLNELQLGAEKLIHSYGFLNMLTLLLKWVASFAAMKEFGKWISLLITVVLRCFLPNDFSVSLEIPGATLFLIATAPILLVETFRDKQQTTLEIH